MGDPGHWFHIGFLSTGVRSGARCIGADFCLGGDEEASERRRSFHDRVAGGLSGGVLISKTDYRVDGCKARGK